MQIFNHDGSGLSSKGILLLIVISVLLLLVAVVIFIEISPKGKARNEENRQKRRKKYSHIPEKYIDLCANDDNDMKNILRGLGSLFVGNSNKVSKFASHISDGVFQTRQSKYINIVADLKLDVNSKYRESFVKEAQIIISEMKPDVPSGWVSYSTFIEWCLKFIERYPIDLSKIREDYIEEPELDLKDIKEQLNKESKSRRDQ